MPGRPAPHGLRVVIGDDSAAVRRRLVVMMSELPSVEVVGEADGAQATFEAVTTTRPDVVLLDIRLPDGSGIDALKRIKGAYPAIRVIMFTNHANPHYRRACMQAGADHFLDKSIEFERVSQLLRDLSADPS